MTIDWMRFAAVVDQHQQFVLTSHIRPDCDALGSELGMAGLLRAKGKSVRIINAHPTPPGLQFLDPAGDIEVLGEHVYADDISTQCILVLDTSAWAQLAGMGDVLRAHRGTKLTIDHHVGEDDLGTEWLKDTSAEATGHLVVQAADAVRVPITREMAIPLYAAIATDTGWFRFGSTTPATMRVVARLIEAGASPQQIYSDLYERDTLGRVRLRGRILSRVTPAFDGRLLHTHVLKEDFAETGALPSDTEDAINLTLAITGTQFAMIMIEQLKGGFKISFRSRCRVDCNEVAKTFGGGGHRAAAGAFLDGDLATVQSRVMAVLDQAMKSA
jgi:bifunctional oligoribonuclease and PAP phosphatase NrnA